MFQYVLFDLDGTLTDPKEGITKSVQFALAQQGVREPNLDKLEPFIGPPLKDSFMEYYGFSQEQAMLAIDDYRKRFAPVGIFENKVYPGIPEMLAALKAEGMKLAVASSKPEEFVCRILEHFSLSEYFDVVVGSNLDGTRIAKEEVVEEALRRLGGSVNRENCAMVGDRKFDVAGAREHGLTAVAVSYGYAGKGELRAAMPDYIAKSVKQLEQFLLGGQKAQRQFPADGQKAPKQSPAGGPQQSAFARTWHILFPFLLYYLGYNACYILLVTLVQLLTGWEGAAVWMEKNSVFLSTLAKACSMLAGAGLLYPLFRREQYFWQRERRTSLLSWGILAGTAALGTNILFSLLEITGISAAYERTAQLQHQVPLLQGLILYGLVSPFAEELLFRGLIYNRMKAYFRPMTAGVVSSLLFGAYHGNLVQGLYGALLGALIVYGYEMTGAFKTPVMMHSIANCVVFVLLYDRDIGNAIGTWVNCAIFLGISAAGLWNIQKRTEN